MLHIRLTRVGKKKQPTYRVIITEKHRDPWGKVLEILGHYNPRSKDKAAVLKADRIKYWIEHGAQASSTVHNLLLREG
ncbi:30S ribosomal protein S16, partial [Patescibacteria group bacterium]|nr:30S ribosomal protein S16 [Patescibacteria group bacterium]MBU1921639.1 30S ribosomal protein S16 [Patescibacteria group bacterium]